MHSFHRSRGRILFEVLCALAISASCVGTWMQTGASALLPAAFVAALYGLVRAFDLGARRRAVTAGPKPVDFVNQQDAVPVSQDVAVPPAAADQPATVDSIEEAVATDPAPSRKKPDRRPKQRRKAGDRRAKSPEQTKASEPAPTEEPQVIEAAPPEEPQVIEAAAPEESQVIEAAAPEEPQVNEAAPAEGTEAAAPVPGDVLPHTPPVRLFEPEPFVRQQRATFGRKAG